MAAVTGSPFAAAQAAASHDTHAEFPGEPRNRWLVLVDGAPHSMLALETCLRLARHVTDSVDKDVLAKAEEAAAHVAARRAGGEDSASSSDVSGTDEEAEDPEADAAARKRARRARRQRKREKKLLASLPMSDHDEIRVLHVVKAAAFDDPDGSAMEYEAKSAAEAFLIPMREKLRAVHGNTRWSCVATAGDPKKVVQDKVYAMGENVQIVMGTRGLSGLAKLRSGSFSEWVLHHCTAPVTVVRSWEDSKQAAGRLP